MQQPFASFPTWWFDYDNDGWLDLFVVAYPNSVEEFVKHYLGQPPLAETLKLYRNDGRGGFTDVSAAAGVARVVPSMGANFGDIDNDGFLDVYLGTGAPSFGSLIPNILLRNDAGRRFDDVTEATGTGHLQKGHGVAFADLDDDGDQDIVLNAGGAVPGDRYDDALFENPGTPGQHWLEVRLIGTRSNRAGDRREDPGRRRGEPEGRRPGRPPALSRGVERRLVRVEQLHPAHRPRPRHRRRVDRGDVAGQRDAPGVPEPPDRHAAGDPRGRRRACGPTTDTVPARSSRRAARSAPALTRSHDRRHRVVAGGTITG